MSRAGGRTTARSTLQSTSTSKEEGADKAIKKELSSVNARLEKLGEAPVGEGTESVIARATLATEHERSKASAFGKVTTLVALTVAVIAAVAGTRDGSVGAVLLTYLVCAGIFLLYSIVLTYEASAAEAARIIVMHRVDVARQTHAEPATEVPPSGLVSWFRKGRGKRSRTSRRRAEQHANRSSQNG